MEQRQVIYAIEYLKYNKINWLLYDYNRSLAAALTIQSWMEYAGGTPARIRAISVR